MAEILIASRFTELGRPEISSTVNISYTQAQRYLKRLSDLRLVDARVKGDNHVCYRTNEKGNRLLIQVESVQQLLQRQKTIKLSM